MRYALDLVAPFPRDFDSRFDRFGAGVHREQHFKAKHFGGKLSKAGKDIVVESPAA
jgi:hypothetical protein